MLNRTRKPPWRWKTMLRSYRKANNDWFHIFGLYSLEGWLRIPVRLHTSSCCLDLTVNLMNSFFSFRIIFNVWTILHNHIPHPSLSGEFDLGVMMNSHSSSEWGKINFLGLSDQPWRTSTFSNWSYRRLLSDISRLPFCHGGMSQYHGQFYPPPLDSQEQLAETNRNRPAESTAGRSRRLVTLLCSSIISCSSFCSHPLLCAFSMVTGLAWQGVK